MSARPTPPHTNPMESGPAKTFFRLKIEKRQKIHDFRTKKREGHFLTPPPLPQNLNKVIFKVGGVWGGPDQKLMGGCVYWTKIYI